MIECFSCLVEYREHRYYRSLFSFWNVLYLKLNKTEHAFFVALGSFLLFCNKDFIQTFKYDFHLSPSHTTVVLMMHCWHLRQLPGIIVTEGACCCDQASLVDWAAGKHQGHVDGLILTLKLNGGNNTGRGEAELDQRCAVMLLLFFA